MMQRRWFLAAISSAPAILRGATERRGYTWAELERILAGGEFRAHRLTREDIPTPALLLDLDAFESNVSKMAAHCQAARRALRPHGKTHKCPEIAKRLIKAGAVGACAAKLSEAEAFAKAGVRGLLVTTAVVGRYKVERAVRLAMSARDTIFSVDNAQNVRDLNDAAGARKVRLNLALDLYVAGRTGITPGEPAVGLGKLIASLPNVKLAGIQAYAGQASHTKGFEERRRVSREAMSPAVDTRRALEAAGIACPLLTGGSTGTYNIDSEMDGITELQPGSFVFMDIDYNRIGGKSGPVYQDFQNSLTVLTTVVSKPTDRDAVVDGGFKAFSTDRPFLPEAKGIGGLVYSWGGDEHGKLNLAQASKALSVGDKVEFVVPHCDPSVNLYDRIFCFRGEQLETIWPISARGMSQ